MLKIVSKIYNRLSIWLVRSRELLFYVSIQNIIFFLIALVFINIILINTMNNGDMNYNNIKLFYNVMFILLFFSITIYTPMTTINMMKKLIKNNSIIYMLSEKIKFYEILIAFLLRESFNIFIIIISSFPLLSISLIYGGISLIKIIEMLFIYFLYALVILTLSINVYALLVDTNLAMLVSYIISIIFFFIGIFVLKFLLNYSYLYIISVAIFIICIIFNFIFANNENKYIKL